MLVLCLTSPEMGYETCSTVCSCFSRLVLYACNTILVIVGFVLLSFGCVLAVNKNTARSLLTIAVNSSNVVQDPESLDELASVVVDMMSVVVALMISIGVGLILLSVLGFCGTCKKYAVLLKIYIVFIGIATLLASILCVYSAVGKKHLEGYGMRKVEGMFRRFDDGSLHSRAAQLLMEHFQCCGAANGTDFLQLDSAWRIENPSLAVPEDCCRTVDDQRANCTRSPDEFNSNFYSGCFEKLWQLFTKHSMKVTIVFAVATSVCAIIIFLTCCIIQHENRDD